MQLRAQRFVNKPVEHRDRLASSGGRVAQLEEQRRPDAAAAIERVLQRTPVRLWRLVHGDRAAAGRDELRRAYAAVVARGGLRGVGGGGVGGIVAVAIAVAIAIALTVALAVALAVVVVALRLADPVQQRLQDVYGCARIVLLLPLPHSLGRHARAKHEHAHHIERRAADACAVERGEHARHGEAAGGAGRLVDACSERLDRHLSPRALVAQHRLECQPHCVAPRQSARRRLLDQHLHQVVDGRLALEPRGRRIRRKAHTHVGVRGARGQARVHVGHRQHTARHASLLSEKHVSRGWQRREEG